MAPRGDVWGLPYKGGKSEIAHKQCEWLAEYAQSAGIYKFVDLCGGGGKIAFSISRAVFSEVTYNDYDVSIVCLMKMIRHHTTLNWLIGELRRRTSTEDNYKLFKEAKEYVEVEQRRRVNGEKEFDKYRLGFAAAILIWGSDKNSRMSPARTTLRQDETFIRYEDFIRGGKSGNSTAERSLLKQFPRLQPVKSGRLYIESIKITNMDAFVFLEQKKRRDDLLVYIDPPYVNDGKKDYYVPWDIQDHEKLIALCENSRLHIAICYGISEADTETHEPGPEELPCYQRLLANEKWHRYSCVLEKKKKKKDERDAEDEFGYIIPLEKTKENKSNRIEIMLCNFEIPSQEKKKKEQAQRREELFGLSSKK